MEVVDANVRPRFLTFVKRLTIINFGQILFDSNRNQFYYLCGGSVTWVPPFRITYTQLLCMLQWMPNRVCYSRLFDFLNEINPEVFTTANPDFYEYLFKSTKPEI